MAALPDLPWLLRGVVEGDTAAIDAAFSYLEADPYYMYSGFLRGKVAGRLARAPLERAQRARARVIVRAAIDGVLHIPFPGLGRLAGAVADNALRRDTRARLHAPDEAIASRALRAVVAIKHPGYTTGDLAAAQAIVLREMRAMPMSGILYPTHERLARRLWTPGWVGELRDIAAHHGPDRAGARLLLAAAARSAERRRRTGP